MAEQRNYKKTRLKPNLHPKTAQFVPIMPVLILIKNIAARDNHFEECIGSHRRRRCSQHLHEKNAKDVE